MPLAVRSAGSLKWLPGFSSNVTVTPREENDSTIDLVSFSTLLTKLLRVRASVLPSEKYALSSSFAGSCCATWREKPGNQREPDTLAIREKTFVLRTDQVAKRPARE